MKNVKTIAEYAIRKWMEQEGLIEECFKLTVKGTEGTLMDSEGSALKLIYNPELKRVFPV